MDGTSLLLPPEEMLDEHGDLRLFPESIPEEQIPLFYRILKLFGDEAHTEVNELYDYIRDHWPQANDKTGIRICPRPYVLFAEQDAQRLTRRYQPSWTRSPGFKARAKRFIGEILDRPMSRETGWEEKTPMDTLTRHEINLQCVGAESPWACLRVYLGYRPKDDILLAHKPLWYQRSDLCGSYQL